MLSFLNRLNLIRYLIVWRVNSSLVFFPRFLSLDLSTIIGTIISNRLPTSERSSWRKTLQPLVNNQNKTSNSRRKKPTIFNQTPWPIESVLFVYPGKRTYGRGELIVWELKLFGEHADHGFFLEVILPAMEEASYTSDPQWNRRNRLWGQFDIQAVYAARGHRWEPFVEDGRLNLRYRANHTQWLEGLTFSPQSYYRFKHLTWITPFDLSGITINPNKFSLTDDKESLKHTNIPKLSLILTGLTSRMSYLKPGRSKNSENLNNLLNTEEQVALQEGFDKSTRISIIKNNITSVPQTWPGKWMGTQSFSSIPTSIIPYLELASILHIGKHTHFGCGTFTIT